MFHEDPESYAYFRINTLTKLRRHINIDEDSSFKFTSASFVSNKLGSISVRNLAMSVKHSSIIGEIVDFQQQF